MKFRDYTPAFREDCISIFKSNMPDFFAPAELHDYKEWLAKLAGAQNRESGANYYYVVLKNDLPVACGGFYISADGWKARMTWGMVHRDWHHMGIGRDFLNFRIRRIRQINPHCSVALDTTQHSFGFFEKQGFVVNAITPDFYAPGMHRYEMELRADNIFL